MLKLSYDELLAKVEQYHLRGRFDVVAFCVGYFGKLDGKHFDMIEKMYLEGIIKE